MAIIRKIAVLLFFLSLLQFPLGNAFAQAKREIVIERADNMRSLHVNGLSVRRQIGRASCRERV